MPPGPRKVKKQVRLPFSMYGWSKKGDFLVPPPPPPPKLKNQDRSGRSYEEYKHKINQFNYFGKNKQFGQAYPALKLAYVDKLYIPSEEVWTRLRKYEVQFIEKLFKAEDDFLEDIGPIKFRINVQSVAKLYLEHLVKLANKKGRKYGTPGYYFTKFAKIYLKLVDKFIDKGMELLEDEPFHIISEKKNYLPIYRISLNPNQTYPDCVTYNL